MSHSRSQSPESHSHSPRSDDDADDQCGFPLLSISCAFKKAAAGQQISCRIPLWLRQPTSLELCPVRRELSRFQITPVTGPFPQPETRPNVLPGDTRDARAMLFKLYEQSRAASLAKQVINNQPTDQPTNKPTNQPTN